VADSTIDFEFDGFAGPTRLFAEAASEDEFLVQALRMGQEEAYELLITRYQQPVYNLVYRLMADPADASDVVQEVFLKIFRNIGAFKGQSSLKTWIYRIACNEAYNHRRWFSRHKKQEVGLETDNDDAQSLQDVLPDPGRSAFEIAYGRQTQEMIEAALAELNPVFRTAVVLRDIEELSYEEIADVLQVSLGTIKSRILRGREALRKALSLRLSAEQRGPAGALNALAFGDRR
jgi:RNA polymerase sigma-70 factor, ECF subfamily